MEQTALQQLIEIFDKEGETSSSVDVKAAYYHCSMMANLFLELEKQQIMDAYMRGWFEAHGEIKRTGEDYFNSKYKTQDGK